MTVNNRGRYLEGSRTQIAHTIDLMPMPGREAEGRNEIMKGRFMSEAEEPPGPGHRPGGPRYIRWCMKVLLDDWMSPLVVR